MSDFVRPGNINVDNFWELNPQLKYIQPFNKVKDQKLMWCIWMWCDPHTDNKIYRLDLNNKLSSIRNYYKSFDPEEEFTTSCIEAYNVHCLSPAARALKEEENALNMRAEMIRLVRVELLDRTRRNPMSMVDKDVQALWAKVEALHANTAKAYQQYETARKIFETETVAPKVYGGRKETIREKGELVIPREDYE